MISPTQNRTYSNPKDTEATKLLSSLLVSSSSPDSYQDTMFRIGQHMGSNLVKSLDPNKSYCIVSTVEDADYLAKGIIDAIDQQVKKVYLTCFWNERKTINGASVAPILNKYFEDGYKNADDMIVVKSIMSGSCVVKTNITALFDQVNPQAIHVVAPVMHVDSNKKLEKQFPFSISKLFKYVFLAKDSKLEDNNVIPGIGGSVYEKLGFTDQYHKNKIIPSIVQEKIFSSL